jgi:hypothetical protein
VRSPRPVRRLGEPRVSLTASGGVEIIIPLAAAAPPLWARFFAYARPRGPRYLPAVVRVDGASLRVVVRAPGDAAAWITCIDGWIAETNARYRGWRSPGTSR